MDDVEGMEIDDEECLDHSKPMRRANGLSQFTSHGSNTGNRSKLNNQQQSNSIEKERKFIRGKRVINNQIGFKFNIILDTNILIEHLAGLKSFFTCRHLMESCKLIIPLIVLQELDLLKKRNKSYVQHFKFINEQLRASKSVISDKTWLKDVPDDIVTQVTNKIDLTELNNDDRVLKSALIIKGICNQPKDSVMLVTDDLNLRNKALATCLTVTDWSGFCEKFGLENSKKLSEKTDQKTAIQSRPNKKIHKISEDSLSSPPPPLPPPHPQNSEESSTKSSSLSDWLSLKYSAEKKLSTFVEKVLKDNYDSLWDKIFDIKLDNASLYEIIKIIKQGWIGTFSDIFSRNKSTKKSIDTLLELLREEKEIDKLTSLVNILLKIIDKSKDKTVSTEIGETRCKKRKLVS